MSKKCKHGCLCILIAYVDEVVTLSNVRLTIKMSVPCW